MLASDANDAQFLVVVGDHDEQPGQDLVLTGPLSCADVILIGGKLLHQILRAYCAAIPLQPEADGSLIYLVGCQRIWTQIVHLVLMAVAPSNEDACLPPENLVSASLLTLVVGCLAKLTK